MKNGFFAYSGRPAASGDCIEEAIVKINKNQGIPTSIRSWRDYAVNGNLIINDVTKAIDEAKYFCADLTGMSDNVLFELGYAIGKDKPIFLIIDTTITESLNRYKELFFLKSLGITKYINSDKIVESFQKEKVFEKNTGSFEELTRQIKLSDDGKPLLYLKSQIDTNFSRKILDKVNNSFSVPCVVDDASESPLQSLSWYLEQLSNVPAVLAEFSSTGREKYANQNAKCSLVCGLAYGMGRELKMVVEDLDEPTSEDLYEIPIDYRDFLVRYRDQKTLDNLINPFLHLVKDKTITFFKNLERSGNRKTNDNRVKKRHDLQNINFGQYVAENEKGTDKCYLDIFSLEDLVNCDCNIVIGRKGSGKTATFYALEEHLNQTSINHVCQIQPVVFEIDGLLFSLENLPENYEQNYVVESIWKLIIYTEIIRSLYEKIKIKHLASHTEIEKKFLSFVDNNSDVFCQDLCRRIAKELSDIKPTVKNNVLDFSVKVSELIHEGTLSRAKEMLGELFQKEREKKIVVLIDNLDQSWEKSKKIELQAKWILGLLNVARRIVTDLSKVRIKESQKTIGFNLTIFLRSDIFKYVRERYPEPDKLGYQNLQWNDSEILFGVIENRFVELNTRNDARVEDLWESYIVNSIDGQPVKKYLFERIMPRPRDLIYFFGQALNLANRRKHDSIQEEDVKSAYEDYSAWVFQVILVESNVTVDIKNFLYTFAGLPQIVTQQDIMLSMEESKIESHSEDKIESFIDFLASISVIGREVKNNEFKYEYGFENEDVIRRRAKRLGTNRYKIHSALASFLDLETNIKSEE